MHGEVCCRLSLRPVHDAAGTRLRDQAVLQRVQEGCQISGLLPPTWPPTAPNTRSVRSLRFFVIKDTDILQHTIQHDLRMGCRIVLL